MKKPINKATLLQILTGVFVSCLIISNVMAGKTFMLGSVILPCAVVIFPLVYITNDVLAEVYGFEITKRIIYLGFAMNAVAVAGYSIAIALPAPPFATEIAEAFAVALGSTWRLLLASFAAYLIGSLLNTYVMVRMKAKLENHLMLRCVTSTFVGEGTDAIIFITIAFIGTMPMTSLLTMIVAQALFKTVYEIIVYPVTRGVINKVKAMPE